MSRHVLWLFLARVAVLLSLTAARAPAQDWREDVQNQGIVTYAAAVPYASGWCFIGKGRDDQGRLARSYGVFRYDVASRKVSAPFPSDRISAVFRGGVSPDDGCFACSSSGQRLAIGLRSTTGSIARSYIFNDIVIVDACSSSLTVAVGDRMDNRNYAWSPDGARLLYFAYPPGTMFDTNAGRKAVGYCVRLLTVDTGQVETVVPASKIEREGVDYLVKAEWAPDGHLAVFPFYDDGPDFCAYDPGARRVRKLAHSVWSFPEFAFCDKKRVVALTEENLWLIDTDSGTTSILAASPAHGLRNLKVVDGKAQYSSGSSHAVETKTVEIPRD